MSDHEENWKKLKGKYKAGIGLLSAVSLFPSFLPTYIITTYLAGTFGLQDGIACNIQEVCASWAISSVVVFVSLILANVIIGLYLTGLYLGWSFNKSKKVFINHDFPENWYKKNT
jgi:hypothetical protein